MTDQPPGRTPPWAMGSWVVPARAPQQPVRIGDAERDEALDRLGDHFAAGRLTREELDERSEKALGARFDRDLDVLFGDLPDPRRDVVKRGQRPPARPTLPSLAVLLVPLLVLAVVAAVAFHGPFLIGPLMWLVILSGGGRRHRYR